MWSELDFLYEPISRDPYVRCSWSRPKSTFLHMTIYFQFNHGNVLWRLVYWVVEISQAFKFGKLRMLKTSKDSTHKLDSYQIGWQISTTQVDDSKRTLTNFSNNLIVITDFRRSFPTLQLIPPISGGSKKRKR